MPIKISDTVTDKEIAWLCGDEWSLQEQLVEFQKWLANNSESISPGKFCADIGYSPRPGAAGGGAGLDPHSIITMAKLGFELFFSEYPEFIDG